MKLGIACQNVCICRLAVLCFLAHEHVQVPRRLHMAKCYQYHVALVPKYLFEILPGLVCQKACLGYHFQVRD
jgi:hypothetical protein